MPKLLLPLVAVLAVGGAAAAGGVYLATRGETVEEVSPPAVETTATPTPTPTAAAETTPNGWFTYTDATYGYSFDYPATWYLVPPGKNGGDVALYSYNPASVPPQQAGMPVPRDKLKVFFWVAEGVDQPLEEWLAEGKTSPGQISPPTVLSKYASTLGGKEGLVEVVEHDGVESINYYTPIGSGRVFVVNAVPADSQVWPKFEAVLGNLRFAP